MAGYRQQPRRPAPPPRQAPSPPPPPGQGGALTKGPDAKKQALATLKKWVGGKADLIKLLFKGDKEAAARFGQALILTAVRSPSLLSCDLNSLFLAALWCAQRGLEPGVEDGCAMVPYKGKVVPIPQYKAIIKQAIQNEVAKQVRPVLVYQKDIFEWEEGENPKLIHKPAPLSQDPGEIIGGYVVITLPDGTKKNHIMRLQDIHKIRGSSAAWRDGEQGPWKDWFEGMALKTLVKQGFKTIPVALKVREILEQDSKLEGGAEIEDVLDIEVLEVLEGSGEGGEPEKSKAAQMAEELKKKAEPPAGTGPPPEPQKAAGPGPGPGVVGPENVPPELTGAALTPPEGNGEPPPAGATEKAPEAGQTQGDSFQVQVKGKVSELADRTLALGPVVEKEIFAIFPITRWEDLETNPEYLKGVEAYLAKAEAAKKKWG